jgi:hypothetical protein
MSFNRRFVYVGLIFVMAAALHGASAENILSRPGGAAAVFNKLTDCAHHGIQPDQIAKADCGAVILGFKKGVTGIDNGYTPHARAGHHLEWSAVERNLGTLKQNLTKEN